MCIRDRSEAYQKGGASAAAKALSDSFSIPVDRYADGDSQSLIDAVNRIGVAEYELSQSLSYNEDGIFISLSAGRQLIDGQKFLDILRYPNYRESDLEPVSYTHLHAAGIGKSHGAGRLVKSLARCIVPGAVSYTHLSLTPGKYMWGAA